MSGSGGKSTTTVQNNEPYKAYQPNIQKAQDMAGKVADDPSAWAAYSGDRYVGPSENSQAAMDGMAQTAQGGVQGLSDAMGQAQGVVNNGAISQNTMGAYDALGSDYLNSMATGSQIGANNANLMKTLEGGADQIATKVNQIASASGRYGSGTNQDVMAKNVGDYYNNALTGQYNQDVNNMMGAQSTLQGLANSQANAEATNASMGLSAGQSLPGLFEGSMSPYKYLAQAGQQQEGYDTAAMQAAMDQFAENQAAQKAPAEWLNAMSSGAGSLGTSSSTAYQSGGGTNQALGWASLLGSFL